MKNLYSNSFTKFYLQVSIVGSEGKFTTWVTSKINVNYCLQVVK